MRSPFQLLCDEAWRSHWLYDLELAEEIDRRQDELADGSATNIYVVRDVESGFIKIGIAARPELRLAGMQTGTPSSLELVDWAPGTLALERFLHKKLAPFRHRGEWFRPTWQVLAVCEMLMSAGDLRRTNEEIAVTPSPDDTVAMLMGPAEWMAEILAVTAYQLSIEDVAS